VLQTTTHSDWILSGKTYLGYGVIVFVIAALSYFVGILSLSDYLSLASLAVVLLLAYTVDEHFDKIDSKLDELLEEKRRRDHERK
jgi:hypothetical protein